MLRCTIHTTLGQRYTLNVQKVHADGITTKNAKNGKVKKKFPVQNCKILNKIQGDIIYALGIFEAIKSSIICTKTIVMSFKNSIPKMTDPC